ncbi:MAG: MBL fold metallo-hydrolase [Rhizobiaceae bacterium]
MTLRFTILGCGSSPGVPRINGDWGACDPTNPKNRRLRCSMLVERIGPDGVTSIVIDTSPDFREQMLAARVSHVDGVLYTHAHADHIHGIDDLRGFALVQQQRVDTYADATTLERLKHGFGYCYETPEGSIYPPILNAHEIRAGKIVTIEGKGGAISALPILQVHGPITSLAFRFGEGLESLSGGLCYSPDVSDLPAQSLDYLENLDVWIVDALQYRSHISHFNVTQSLEWIARLKPSRAILTHMHTPLDYGVLKADLPTGVEPAYDGMVITIGRD